jgi:hypothetical protein
LKVLDVTTQNWQNTWQPIWNDVKNQFSNNWTWQGGASLGGSLYIDAYQAHDTGTTYCTHWAELLAHYDKITVPAGEKVEWVQVYKKSGAARDPCGYGNQSGWSFDPPANVKLRSGKTTDKAPFYYNEGENHYDPQPGIPDNQIFRDKSQQYHLEKNSWNGDMEFDLFLVSWDGSYDETKPHTLTVHDGFAWGFNGYCTPEPSTLLLLGSGLALLRRRRGKVD